MHDCDTLPQRARRGQRGGGRRVKKLRAGGAVSPDAGIDAVARYPPPAARHAGGRSRYRFRIAVMARCTAPRQYSLIVRLALAAARDASPPARTDDVLRRA